MGCEVVSVYADQIIGRMNYSDSIIQDLVERDYRKGSKLLSYKELSSKVNLIYGFTQSYCQSFFFTSLIKQKQFFIYNCGRFLIKTQIKSLIEDSYLSKKKNSQQIISFQDLICAMDLCGKLCAVGIVGGTIEIWDLQFMEAKVQIKLPEPSVSFSSISLNNKYLFCTDNTHPNSIAYIFDLKTTKLKGSGIITSRQPILRGINFLQNCHVTIAADGVWFMRYSNSNNAVDIVKGMFGQFPKTSMTALDKIQDKYIISGSVDGYIFIWGKESVCLKVVKCAQDQISCIKFSKNKLLVCTMNNKIKCFSFNVYEKTKNKDSQQKQEQVEYTITDAYQSQSPIQRITIYQQQSLLYFMMNRSGCLKVGVFPSNQPTYQKIKNITNKQLIRHNRKGQTYIISQKTKDFSNFVMTVYPKNKNSFILSRLSWNQQTNVFQIQKLEEIQTQQRQENKFYTFSQKMLSVAYLSKKSIYITRLSIIPQTINFIKSVKIFDMEDQNIIGLNYLQIQNQIWFILTTHQNVHIFQVKTNIQYQLNSTLKGKDKISFKTKSGKNVELVFDKLRFVWNTKENLQKLQNIQLIQQTHLALLKDYNKQLKLSIGGCMIIKWR